MRTLRSMIDAQRARIRTGDGMDAVIGVLSGLGLSMLIWFAIIGIFQ